MLPDVRVCSSPLMQPAEVPQSDWNRFSYPAKAPLDCGHALSLAIQKVLQTPRMQLQVWTTFCDYVNPSLP